MGDSEKRKREAGAQALESDPGGSSPPPPRADTPFGTMMGPTAADSDPTSDTILSPGTPPPAARTPRPVHAAGHRASAATPVTAAPAPQRDNLRLLSPVWALTVLLAAGLGAVVSRAPGGASGASRATRQELAAVQQSLRALQAEHDRTRADLEDQVVLLTAERERLLALHADLRETVARLREPQATTATVRLDAPISLTVEEAACTVTLQRINPGLPHLQVQLEVANRGPRALPGVMQLTFLDETLTEVGRANFNLFGEGAFEDLGPGERRVMQGSVRIRASRSVPTHFWLVFVR